MRVPPLPILLAVALLSGCNVVRWQQYRIESQLRALHMVESTRAVGDAQIAYWDGDRTGTPHRPVLLIHGFGGSAIWTWTHQAADLAADRRVLMPDLIGFGGSQSSGSSFTVDRQVRRSTACWPRSV